MKTLKKLLCATLALSLTLALTACGGQDPAASASGSGEGTVYRIGISQYGEHPSLDNCRTGFLQGLEEAGLKEGVDFTVDYQNANFDDATATQIAGSFSAGGVDMMVGIATPAAVACYAAAEEKDIPVIFTAITDPVGAKLDSGNITGTSDVLPVAAQLELIRALQPDAKTHRHRLLHQRGRTPSTPWASMRSWPPATASPSRAWASPPRARSPRPSTPSSAGAWTASPT